MVRAPLARVAAVLALTLAAPCAQAVSLIHGLGGPADFGPNNLPPNDDGSTDLIDVRAAFPNGLHFFGSNFAAVYVNNNGNITFRSALGVYTPQAFPVASQPMIAPWWGDVDTRPGGMPSQNGVYWSVGDGRLVVTWHNVGYFANHTDQLNDFQLVMLDRSDVAPGDFDVEFRYDRCEWVSGDASSGHNGHGGVQAQAGFDAGNQTDFFVIPGSLSEDIVHVCDRSNVGVAGLWRFEIRNGLVHSEPDPDAGFDPFFDDVMVPCTGRNCHPELKLEGSAGPCVCTAPGAAHPTRGIAWLLLGSVALIARRRWRR